jgi:hypothetical protein
VHCSSQADLKVGLYIGLVFVEADRQIARSS